MLLFSILHFSADELRVNYLHVYSYKGDFGFAIFEINFWYENHTKIFQPGDEIKYS